jgi:peptidoglycan/xylan/chitin deacetylase (PgdA/CDA1 family)
MYLEDFLFLLIFAPMKLFLPYSPKWLQALYPGLLWRKAAEGEKVVYLTFDDGPTPEITDWVLEQLAAYKALASFFLIGKNADANPDIITQIKESGHSIGNHTQNHLNGWQKASDIYLKNVDAAEEKTSSTLFRPPYGRIKRKQIKGLKKRGYNIIMWDVLSGDFDPAFDAKTCTRFVLNHTRSGSIIVFHDSKKAWPNLKDTLPKVLESLNAQGYQFRAL